MEQPLAKSQQLKDEIAALTRRLKEPYFSLSVQGNDWNRRADLQQKLRDLEASGEE